MDKELQRKILEVMLGKKDEAVEEAKKPLHPNQQKIDVHEPEKDEITSKDFEMLRAGKKAKMKEEVEEELDEAGMPSSVIKHKQKLANMSDQEFAKAHGDKSEEELKQMAWRHGYGKMSSHYVNRVNKGKSQMEETELEEAEELDELKMSTLRSYVDKAKAENLPGKGGNRGVALLTPGTRDKGVHRAVERMRKMKEEFEFEDDADETIFVHTPVEYDVKESYNFGDYLTAAKNIVGEEEAINLANDMFKSQDISIFAEQFMRSDIESKVKMHQNAGHKVSTPKYSTKSGKPYAEYVVTDKESGVRRKYIHHGSSRSMENMGAAGKKDE